MDSLDNSTESSGFVPCLIAGVLITIATVVAVRYPLRFTVHLSDIGMIRGMTSALVFCPLVAIALYLTLRKSKGAFFASIIVPSFFSALWIHEVEFGSKMPELAYQEPLNVRIAAVIAYLSPLVALPAMLAMIPFLRSPKASPEVQIRKAEQDASDRPL